jgi:hypothetical protein
MLKNDPEFLIKILDDYSSGATNSLEMLAQRNSISVRALFMWMRDADIKLDYMGRENVSFGQAMGMARNVMKVITVGRTLEDYVLNGRRTEVWHHGEPQYLEDEALVALGRDYAIDVLGYPDLYKRDENGNRIIRTRVEYAPAALIEKYAAANMPAVYGSKSELTVRNLGTGVTTIGEQPPIPPEVQARLDGVTETRQIEAQPDEVDILDDEIEEFEAVPELRNAEPEPERVIREPTEMIAPPTRPIPAGWQAEWDKLAARSPVSQEIFDKLKVAREKNG